MFDIEDGTLLSHTDCMVGICLKEYSKIFVTGILEDHPDHKAAFLCIREAAKRTVAKEMPECYLYEVHTPLQSPTHFLDISDVVEEKCRLIRIHRSQLKELPYDVLAEQCACYRATLCRMPEKKLEVYEAVDLSEKTEPVIHVSSSRIVPKSTSPSVSVIRTSFTALRRSSPSARTSI